MVFPTLPVYLDPPNWSQQQTTQQAGIGTQILQIPHPPQPPPSTAAAAAVGGGGYQGSIIRPGSMTDRARLAKIPQPDAALNCPRCESTNTKFCYYNNYSLSQPRHFCKTCRRYWTRGGALRNVPVGGGCRRNKRTKRSSRTKSPTKAYHRHASGSTSSSANSSSSVCATDVIKGHLTTPAPSQLSFLPPLHHYSDHVNVSGGTGMHFEAIPPTIMTRNGNTSGSDAEFQSGTGSLGDNNGGSMLLNGLAEQWRMPNLQQVHQQFPFLTNLEPPIGLFQFDGENAEPPSSVREGGGRFRPKAMDSSVSGMPQLNTTKMEDDDQGLSLTKNLLGSSGNDLFWAGSGNAWDENPSFASSTSHLL